MPRIRSGGGNLITSAEVEEGAVTKGEGEREDKIKHHTQKDKKNEQHTTGQEDG